MALAAARAAADTAAQLGDDRAASYALEQMGSAYVAQGRLDDALVATERAILAAQRIAAPEALYRAEWRHGRILRALHRDDDAVAAYRRALRTLQPIRNDLLRSLGRNRAVFYRRIRPVYTETADVLLVQAAAATDGDRKQALLAEARRTMESLKAAELEEYFGDTCVTAKRPVPAGLDALSGKAVIIYPILLPDRTELLVDSGQKLLQVTVPVSEEEITRAARSLRVALEEPGRQEFLQDSQRLYDWLIRPIEGVLKDSGLDTLVFVPSGPLLTIPMSALHDGTQFLVQRFAVVLTPSFDLTDARPFERARPVVLSAGISESVQGYPALPSVAVELEMVHKLYGGSSLLNQEFVVPRIESDMKDHTPTIVHFASHAEFHPDAGESFLLAYDDKLDVNRLNDLLGAYGTDDKPLELLALSACDTAAGDDRAALGLAGIAVRAGAKGVLATLWSINDRSSAALVGEFYRQLQDPAVSKAVALQRAQLRLLASDAYAHPGFWSAFVMINNWL